MADFDPSDLDLRKVRARLKQRNPKPWKQPSSPLPVDRFVSELRKRPRSPKLRSPADLAALDDCACPYAIARDGVWWATVHASFRSNRNELRADVTAAMKEFSKDVGEGLTVIQKLYDRLSTIYRAQERAFDPAVDALSKSPLRDTDYLLLTHSTLQRLERPIRDLYVQRSQGVGNVWRIEFAASLFRPWWVLTGKDPSPKGQFVEFVDDAYQSLGDNLPETHWESAVVTAKQNVKREHGADAQPWHVDRAAAAAPPISSRQFFDAYADDLDTTTRGGADHV